MNCISKILLLCLTPFIALGQVKHDYVWLNGTDGAPNVDPSTPGYERFGINTLSFNGGELNITRDYRDSDFYLTNASISSADGELLFYTNGCNVFQADGEIMENGEGLNPGVAYDVGLCPDDGNAVSAGALILPLPGSDSIYYIFHNSNTWGDTSPFLIYNAVIYSTVIDVSANNGSGQVLEKNQIEYSDSLSSDLHAVRHSNGMDWWVLFSDGTENVNYSLLFTEAGIGGVFEQSIGPTPDPWTNEMSCFSPDGSIFARYEYGYQVALFDFDRETGELSNYRYLEADTDLYHRWGYSIAFSPSGRFLYVASTNNLYQFDLEAQDIQGSRTLIGEYDGYEHLGSFPTNFGYMRLAPDCKIYFPALNATPYYHCIEFPDRKGHACGFRQRGLLMPATNIASIPNFPNYRLGTGYPVCDSTIQLVVSSVPVLPPRQEVLVYPNPASGLVTVELSEVMMTNADWILYNGVGQVVHLEKLANGTQRKEVGITGVPSGLYYWELRNPQGWLGNGKLIKVE